MARRRNEPGLLDVALKSDWRFSASLAAGAAVLGLVIVPAVARGNPILAALVPLGTAAGLLFAGVFGLIAGGKLLAKHAAAVPATTTAVRGVRSPTTRTSATAARAVVDVDPREYHAPRRIEPELAARPTTWSLELLQSLDWKRFEEVVAAYFREKNFRSETIECGPDGGVDVRLFFGDSPGPVGIVQCKAWGKRQVGVGPVRELLGVMAHEKVARGYFAATGDFSADAIAFAKANPIMLISGADFLIAISKMDSARSAALFASATEGDYSVPSCPSCGTKLYRRTFKNGSTAWVCKGYPACRTRIFAKAS